MGEFVKKLINGFESDGFVYGYISGFVFLLLIALILLIVYVFFIRPRRIMSVPIPMLQGMLVISAAAISDLVKSLDAGFKNIDILKVQPYRYRGEIRLKVYVNFLRGAETMVETTSALQQSIIKALETSFGIKSIKTVHVKVKRTPALAPSSF